MKQSRNDVIVSLIRQHGILRPRDLDHHGIPREYLRRMQSRGLVHRVGRGLYVLPDSDITEHHSLAQACKRVPHATVCLLSALRYHDMTTEAPFEVWLAIGPRARRPTKGGLRMRFFHFSGPALTEGVETHIIEGVPVKIYGAAKTVADCFKYRHKIGLDVALEALRDCWRARRASMDELWSYAKLCRVAKIMRPYLESIA